MHKLLAEVNRAGFRLTDEISKRLGQFPKILAKESQTSWSRLFPSPDADFFPPETKGLNPEEASFIEKYLKLADELLGAAALAQKNPKTKKTG